MSLYFINYAIKIDKVRVELEHNGPVPNLNISYKSHNYIIYKKKLSAMYCRAPESACLVIDG